MYVVVLTSLILEDLHTKVGTKPYFYSYIAISGAVILPRWVTDYSC